MKKYAIINGPNLNRLGKRQPEIYGRETIADLDDEVQDGGSVEVDQDLDSDE